MGEEGVEENSLMATSIGLYIRAALSGNIIQRVPNRVSTLKELRSLVNQGLERSVPHYCIDLIGHDGRLISNDADLGSLGTVIDVIIVCRKVVCPVCYERLSCFCRARSDEDCVCEERIEDYCGWCLYELKRYG